jgi:serine protein kinase
VNLDDVGMAGAESATLQVPDARGAAPPHPARVARARREGARPLQPQVRVNVEGDLDPACRFIFNRLMDKYGGDWSKVMQHIRVRRLVLSRRTASASAPSSPRTRRTRTRPS